MKTADLKFILTAFFLWRIYLILLSVIAVNFVPLKEMFLAGGFLRQWNSPYILSWANFDGEHYLSIAKYGYKHLEQAFFPVYPILMNILTRPFGLDEYALSITGLLISNLSLFLALLILWKLIRLDYASKIAQAALISLLVFPTSFYLGAVFNESLYLLLSVLVFYLARKNQWFLASLFGALSSATRIFGVLLLPALLIEAWQQKLPLRRYFWIVLIPLGLLVYMYYQKVVFDDPFLYYKLQLLVGEQHQKGIVLLPQVFFRYLKILTNVQPSNLIYQTVFLEFVVGVVFTLLPVYAYLKKVRLSYIFYLAAGFLSPTIQGSFTSVPRYVLVFFPAFITLAILISKAPKWVRIVYLTFSLFWLAAETALFLRGYWVA